MIKINDDIELIAIDSILPYDKNARNHDSKQVAKIAESISKFGFNQPLALDENNVILVGHGRYEAAKKLKLPKVPCLILRNLPDEDKKAYRILDNKIQNDSTWNIENLQSELSALKALGFDGQPFGLEELNSLLQLEQTAAINEKYSKKITAPIYTPKKECPKVEELFDNKKTESLLAEIKNAPNIPEDLRFFLQLAAYRHTKINFENVAEYYSHAPANVQRLMESSALVVIDIDKAIENGFCIFIKDCLEIIDEEEACSVT